MAVVVHQEGRRWAMPSQEWIDRDVGEMPHTEGASLLSGDALRDRIIHNNSLNVVCSSGEFVRLG